MPDRKSKFVPQVEDGSGTSVQRVPNSMVVPKAAPGPAIELPLDPELFAYELLDPRTDVPSLMTDRAYRCWKAVWGQTLLELDGSGHVFSDDFSRQHEIGALFYGADCVGLSGYRFIDLSLQASRDDSYFKVWPSDVLESVLAIGRRICVGSNLTVLPEWRGTISGYSVKETLMTLAVRRFLASRAALMVGTMRNDRGMNGLVYRLGARPVVENVVHHGVAVDLVTFNRADLAPITPSPPVAALSEKLWSACSKRRDDAS